MRKPRIWIVCSVSILLIVGLVQSGPSPSVTLTATRWTPIGPAPVNGPFAGRIDVAAANPSNPNVMYLGANNAGIWKTTNWTNSNPTWTEITDKPQILSLAVHEHGLILFPGNPDIVIAAASGPGGGIMRSDDAGSTWSFLGNSKFDLAEFGAIVVDPNVANAQTLYVAISGGSANFVSGSGLYKSMDGGTTWSDAGVGVFSGFVTDLLQIQESGTTVLYAADPVKGDVYRSVDGGAIWSASGLPAGTNPYESIRLAGSTAPTEKIYASAIDNSNHDGLAGVVTRFVTSDKGGHWIPLKWPDAPKADSPGQSHRDHHNVLAVNPANSSNVFVNTDLENNLLTHNPDGSEKYTEFIWKSDDSGQTWQAAVDGGGDPVSGGFDGSGVFVVTSDGGIHRDPVNVYDNRGGNLNTIEFYGFSLDANNRGTGYGLFQDGPGVLKYVGVVDWHYTQPPHGTGEAGKIRVDPTNANRVYFLDPNTGDSANSPTASARFVHSDDGGQHWTAAITGLPTIVDGNGNTITDYASFPGKGSLVIDPNNPKRLLLAIHNSVFETITGGDPNTTDSRFGGNGWRNIGQNMANNGWISVIALAPSDPNTVFAGNEDGRVFKTTNAGNGCNPNCPTWTEVDSGLPLHNQRIMGLEISPTNPDYDFAVTCPFMGRDDKAPNFSGFHHVWVRNGADWSQINGNLPRKLGGETLAVDWQPTTPALYLGTLRGAYQSQDLGTTWTRMDTLPRTRVTDLDFMPNLQLLGAGTIGWGAWEILTSVGNLANISTRMKVEAGDNALIGGFIVTGSAPKKVMIRAIGPSLAQFGVSGVLANPQLELHDSSSIIGMNDDWQTTQIGGVITSNQAAEIQSSGLAPSAPAESAIIATLAPGPYTAIVQGVNNTNGVGLVEVYDLSGSNGASLANISTRGFVQTGANVMIGGLIVVTHPVTLVIRAIGPSLTQFGVAGALANPKLELHDANNTIARNDDWQTTLLGGIITSDQVAAIQNSGLAPNNSAESVIIATLQPGTYTAIVQGVNNTTGVALVEVYALP